MIQLNYTLNIHKFENGNFFNIFIFNFSLSNSINWIKVPLNQPHLLLKMLSKCMKNLQLLGELKQHQEICIRKRLFVVSAICIQV